MKRQSLLTRFVAIGLLIVSGFLGLEIGYMTIYRYDMIVKAILGLAVIYLALRLYVFTSSRSNEINNFYKLFEFPKNIKYYIFAFTWSLISYWALQQIVDMIIFFVRR